MYGMFSAPFAVFFQFQPFLYVFLVFAGKIIVALANRAFEFYKIFLRHAYFLSEAND